MFEFFVLLTQISHRRHHMYHNHEDKDYSHPWYTPEKLAREDEGLARMMHSQAWMRLLFPYVGWQLYLYGLPDGSHFIPFVDQRMWAESTAEEKRNCYISTFGCIAFAALYYYLCGSWLAFGYYIAAPCMVFGWWLVTVTYLQHHDHNTLVYTDNDWNFVTAAFETVDRKFGFGIDAIHHHITDGHVAHHLFFTKIPHYNLPIATKAIRQYMEDNNLGHMYKYDECRDFFFRVHQYFVKFGLKAKRAPSSAAKKAD
jgi:acyl-lipid omega-3 desaturase